MALSGRGAVGLLEAGYRQLVKSKKRKHKARVQKRRPVLDQLERREAPGGVLPVLASLLAYDLPGTDSNLPIDVQTLNQSDEKDASHPRRRSFFSDSTSYLPILAGPPTLPPPRRMPSNAILIAEPTPSISLDSSSLVTAQLEPASLEPFQFHTAPSSPSYSISVTVPEPFMPAPYQRPDGTGDGDPSGESHLQSHASRNGGGSESNGPFSTGTDPGQAGQADSALDWQLQPQTVSSQQSSTSNQSGGNAEPVQGNSQGETASVGSQGAQNGANGQQGNPHGNSNPPASPRHPLNTPVLHTVHRLGGPNGDQLFIQGAIDSDAPVGAEMRVKFYAAPVAVVSGGSAFPEAFASTVVVKRNAGLTGFTALVDADLGQDQSLFAKAEGPFQTSPKLSKLYEVRASRDDDGDGVGEEVERLGPGEGDANQDGIPDKQQPHVASFPASNGQFLTLDAHGNILQNVRTGAARAARRSHDQAPLGIVSFEVGDLTPGQAITVDLMLPEGAGVDKAYKQHPLTGQYYSFDFDGTTGAVFRDNVVTLHLVDGGRGDADGIANGRIADPLLLDYSDEMVAGIDVVGWTHFQTGGSGPAVGSVAVEAGNLVLREGNSFEAYAEKRLVVPVGVQTLEFDYIATFDTTDGTRINDAFEAALVDDTGVTLAPTIRFGRDSYFNLTEEQHLAELGEGAEHNETTAPSGASAAGTVRLDVSHLADGISPRTLVVRLVNNDHDTGTVVQILGNHRPEAQTDNYTTLEDNPLQVSAASGVLLNDYDIDLDPLSAVRVLGLTDGPFFGTVVFNGDGSFNYTPDPHTHGIDSFEYRVWDGQSYSAPTTVTITVQPVNDSPVAANDAYVVAHSGQATGGVMGNDYDPDVGDVLQAELVTGPTQGTLTLNANGTFTYQHGGGQTTTDQFTYKVFDDDLAYSNTATVTLTIQEENTTGSPPAVDVGNVATTEGSAVQMSATFADPDGSTINVVVINWGDGTISSSSTSGSGITVSQSNGSGTITASHVYADDQPANYQVTVTATDQDNLSGSDTSTGMVSNVAPELTAGLAFAAVSAQGNTLQQAAVITGRFTDPGFDRLTAGTTERFTVTIDWGDGSQQTLTHQELSVIQGDFTRQTSGSFVAQHVYTEGGFYSIEVTVQDDDGGQDTVTLGNFGVLIIDEVPVVNLKSGGRLLVKIKGNQGIDLSQIDPETVRFGPAGAEAVNWRVLDDANAHSHFHTQETGIRPTDHLKLAFLTAKLYDGTVIVGADIIRIANGSDNGLPGVKPAETVPVGASKFFVADAGANRVFRYSDTGAPVKSVALDTASLDVRGVTIYDNDPHDLSDAVMLSIGGTHQVSVQGTDGSVVGSWRAFGLENPQGIATDGKDVWVVDADIKRVVHYAAMGKNTSFFNVGVPTSSFALDAANTSPSDITTDGHFLWVTDDSADRVFVYSVGGSLEGSWQLDPLNADASGLTGALPNAQGGPELLTTLWVVDRVDRKVYQYTGAKNWRDDQQAQSAGPNPFALVAQNGRPEGIADPEPNNSDPVVQDDNTYQVQPEGAIRIYVLNNDYDTDGDVLTITNVGTPSSGVVQISSTGDYITYTADTNFTADSFTYTVSDGHGGTANATIWLENEAYSDPGSSGPTANDDDVYLYHIADGATVDIFPLDNDDAGSTTRIVSVGTPSQGSVQIDASGLFIRYTPTAGHVDDSFTYTIEDGDENSSIGTVWLDDDMLGGYGGGGGQSNTDPTAEDDFVYDVLPDVPVNIYAIDNDWDDDLSDVITIISVTTPGHGTAQISLDGTYITYEATEWFTTDSFTYTISDGQGGVANATVWIERGGYDGPVAYDDDVYDVVASVALDIYVLDNDEGEDLAIIDVSAPSQGTVQISSGGTYVIYTPDAGFTADSFTYTAEDLYGLTTEATVWLEAIVNTAPMADDDYFYDVVSGIPLDLYVLDNDWDDESDPLTIIDVDQPDHGSVQIMDGYLRYVADANFVADSFTYTISDGQGNSAFATVWIEAAVNLDPVADDDYFYDVTAGIPANLYVLDNDWDDEGDPLTIVAVGQPSHGTVQIRSGYLTYVPGENFVSDTFTYTIDDGHGNTAIATIWLEGPADEGGGGEEQGLWAEDDYINELDEGGTTYLYVLDNDFHGENLAFSVTSVSQPVLGTVQISGDGEYLIFTPDVAFTSGEFQYTISDGQGQTITATVYIEPWDYDWRFSHPDYYRWYREHAEDRGTVTDAPALELARAMAVNPALVVSAGFEALPQIQRSYGVGNSKLGAYHSATAAPSYAVLSTGEAGLVNDPGQLSSYNLNGPAVAGNSDRDVTILRIDLEVPAGANYLSFDFQFMSEEFPTFLADDYNDAFIAELDNSTWTTLDGAITAPDNFAVLAEGMPVSLANSALYDLSREFSKGTAFDGQGEDAQGAATPLFRARTPITPGPHTLFLSIFDQGDSLHDSAALLSNLKVGKSATPVQPGMVQVLTVDAWTVKNPFDAYTDVLISGTVPANQQLATVTINGNSVPVIDAANRFFATVTALPGRNTFEVVAADADGTSQALETVSFEAALRQEKGINWDLIVDASASVLGEYGVTSFNERPDILYADVAIENIGSYSLRAPLLVGVINISRPEVRVRDADGVTPDGIPYYDFSKLLVDGALDPGESTETGVISFFNPDRAQFDYDLVVLGRLNKAPRFTSLPVVEVAVRSSVVGEYRYQSTAYDENQDSYHFELLAGPSGMQVESTTGLVTWDPDSADVGTHSVYLRVEDEHGGFDVHHFTVRVTENLANRPPAFTSLPITEAYVGVPYSYMSQAIDLDGDTLTFAVDAGPVSYPNSGPYPAPHPSTAEVTWTPTADDVDKVFNVVLSVNDGQYAATQPYQIRVLNQPGNRPPIITSDPSLLFEINGERHPTTGDVDPDSLELDLGLGQTSSQTVSLTLSPAGTLADVFLTLDDTGSFAASVPQLVRQFPLIVKALQEDPELLGVNYAFGIGRFEDYADFDASASGRPFILNQPILSTGTSGFMEAIKAALQRTAPGNGGDEPESLIEALFQVATGFGYDGNPGDPGSNGTLDSGAAGLYSTQTNPGGSGDVPAFASFMADPEHNILGPSGTLGGVGFRFGATPIILAATDAGTAYEPDLVEGYGGPVERDPITGIGGVTLPLARLTQASRNEPIGGGAKIQETIDWLNALGARVIGLGRNTAAGEDPRQLLEALAILTGTVNNSTDTVDSGIAGDQIAPGDPFYFYLNGASSEEAPPGAEDDYFQFREMTLLQPVELHVLNNDWDEDGDYVRITQVTQPDYGSVAISETGDYLIYTPDPEAGFINSQFSYTIDDDINGSSTANVMLENDDPYGGSTEPNVPPTATDDTVHLFHLNSPRPIKLYPLMNDWDDDGDRLRITSVTQPTSGMLAISPNGDYLIYSPHASFVDDTFSYTIDDGEGNSQSATVALDDDMYGGMYGGPPELSDFGQGIVEAVKSALIRVNFDVQLVASINGAPVANLTGTVSDVSFGDTISFDTLFTGDGFRHGFDLLFVRADTGTILGSVPVSIRDDYRYDVDAIDPDQDPITYSLLEGTTAGAIINATTGMIDWTPPGAGEYEFVVQALDDRGGKDVQEFTVVVTSGAPNTAPTIDSVPTTTLIDSIPTTIVTIGYAYEYQVQASDADSDPLEYFLAPHQQAEVPAGMSIDRLTGRLLWTPVNTDPASVIVRVSDGRGAATEQQIVFGALQNRTNSSPEFGPAATLYVNVGEDLVFQPTATDSDGDPLSFDRLVGPAGMTIYTDTGTLAWRPALNQAGPHQVILRVRDPLGGYDLLEFNVVVAGFNVGPTLISDPPTTTVIAGRVFQYLAAALDPNINPLATDPNNTDELTFTVSVSAVDPTDSAPTNSFSFVGTPFLDRDVLQWTSTENEIGSSYRVTVVATDEGGISDSQSFVLTIVAPSTENTNPVIETQSLPTAIAGRHYQRPIVATDEDDGDVLEYLLESGPTGASIDRATGMLSWPVPIDIGQAHPVLVRVRDGRGGEARRSLELPVYGNRAPQISTLFVPGPGVQGHAYQATIQASDPDGDPFSFSVAVTDAMGNAVTTGNPSIGATSGQFTPSYSRYLHEGIRTIA